MAKKDSARESRAAKAEQMRLDREKAEKRQRNIITAVIVVVVVALIAGAWYAIQYTIEQNRGPDFSPETVTADNGILITPEDLGGETTDDTVDIVIWEDMSCPACQAFFLENADYLDRIVADGQATIEYRFANFLDRNSPNNHSTRAAAAAVCVFEEDGAEAFKNFQFSAYLQQPTGGAAGPDNEEFADMAIQSGASEAAVECIEGSNFRRWVERSARAFQNAEVTATPGVIVAGQVLESNAPAEIQAALDAARGVDSGDDDTDVDGGDAEPETE